MLSNSFWRMETFRKERYGFISLTLPRLSSTAIFVLIESAQTNRCVKIYRILNGSVLGTRQWVPGRITSGLVSKRINLTSNSLPSPLGAQSF